MKVKCLKIQNAKKKRLDQNPDKESFKAQQTLNPVAQNQTKGNSIGDRDAAQRSENHNEPHKPHSGIERHNKQITAATMKTREQ